MKNQSVLNLFFILIVFSIGCHQKIYQSTYTEINELPSEYANTNSTTSSASPPPNQIAHYEADVISYSDYYPYGMMMPGRNGGDYRFGFNGMEGDDEVKGKGNSLDFKFRNYDDRLGRFTSADPLIQKYPSFSSFTYALNSPIKFIDLEGLEIAVKGTSSDEFINLLSNRTGLELTKDPNGFLTYATTISLNDPSDITKGFKIEPKIIQRNKEYVSEILRNEVIKIINGGIGIEPVEIIAKTQSEIKNDSPAGTDNILFDQFPYDIPNELRNDDQGLSKDDNVVDITDFQNINPAPLLQAAFLGHILRERSSFKGSKVGQPAYDISHTKGLNIEGDIIREKFPLAVNRIEGNSELFMDKEINENTNTGFFIDFGESKGIGFLLLIPFDGNTNTKNNNEVKGVEKVE